MTSTQERSYGRGGVSPMGGAFHDRDDFDEEPAPTEDQHLTYPEPPPPPPASPSLTEVTSEPAPTVQPPEPVSMAKDESMARHRSPEPEPDDMSPGEEVVQELPQQPLAVFDGDRPEQYLDYGNPEHVWDRYAQAWIPRNAFEAHLDRLHASARTMVQIPHQPLPESWAPKERRAHKAWIRCNRDGIDLPAFPVDELAELQAEGLQAYEPIRRRLLMEERRSILERIIANPYEFTMTILIVSWRGGAGKTQTTAELSAITRRELVQLMATVVAMDGNADFGMLLYRLGIEDDPRAKNTLIKTADGIENLNSLKAMQNVLPVSKEGVMAVPLDFRTPETRNLPQAELDALRHESQKRVHQRMCYSATHIFIDGGTGDNGITRASREVSELIILPGHLDREGRTQIRELLKDLAEDPSSADLVGRTIILVMNYEPSQFDALQALKVEYTGEPTMEHPIKVGAVRTLCYDPAADGRQVANPSLLDPLTYNQYFDLIATGHEVLRDTKQRRELPLYIPATLKEPDEEPSSPEHHPSPQEGVSR